MKTVMVSDLHLMDRADPVQRQFVEWLRWVGADEVVLLGDIFHAWWGYRAGVQGRYRPACDALLGARGRGVRFVYVVGNHDFSLGSFFRDELEAEVCGAHERVIQGRRWWLAHGDECDSSAGYKLTRAMLRSRPFALWMRALGPARGDRFVAGLAGSGRARPAASERLLQEQARWARDRLALGADCVALGHLHRPGRESFPEGELFRLGDWSGGPVWLEIEDGRPRLLRGLVGGVEELA